MTFRKNIPVPILQSNLLARHPQHGCVDPLGLCIPTIILMSFWSAFMVHSSMKVMFKAFKIVSQLQWFSGIDLKAAIIKIFLTPPVRKYLIDQAIRKNSYSHMSVKLCSDSKDKELLLLSMEVYNHSPSLQSPRTLRLTVFSSLAPKSMIDIVILKNQCAHKY